MTSINGSYVANPVIAKSRIHDEIPKICGDLLLGALVTALAIGVLTLLVSGIYSGATHTNFKHILNISKTPVFLGGFIASVIGGMIYAGQK